MSKQVCKGILNCIIQHQEKTLFTIPIKESTSKPVLKTYNTNTNNVVKTLNQIAMEQNRTHISASYLTISLNALGT